MHGVVSCVADVISSRSSRDLKTVSSHVVGKLNDYETVETGKHTNQKVRRY